MRISGASVLLTGATGGIGHAIARGLSRNGANLILTGRRAAVLEALAAELGAQSLTLDLSNAAEVARLAAAAPDVDILVANAGLPASGLLESFSIEEIDRAIDVNLRSPIMLARALTPGMVGRGRGHLVFVSSLSGKTASPRSSIYSATKFGLRGFALGLRADLRPRGVGVSVVYPGFIRGAGMFAESGVKLPPGVGTRAPDDVARAVVSAIQRDRAEIDIAPLSLRAGAVIAGLVPEAAAAVSRRLGEDRIAGAVAEGQRAKR
jgi:short-subunit dehydrogenase